MDGGGSYWTSVSLRPSHAHVLALVSLAWFPPVPLPPFTSVSLLMGPEAAADVPLLMTVNILLHWCVTVIYISGGKGGGSSL